MTDSEIDEKFMRIALDQAIRSLAIRGAGEVGCVIVKDGEVAACGFNEGERSIDHTAHAEIVAIRNLAKKWQDTDLDELPFIAHFSPAACAAWLASGPTSAGLSMAQAGKM